MTDLNTPIRQPGENLPSSGLDFEPEQHGITLQQLFNPPTSFQAMRAERDDAMTRAMMLQMERGALKSKVEELEESNQSLRETLDKVRRELAEARLKLEQRAPDTTLEALAERVNDLEDVIYPLDASGQPVSRTLGREVQTLVQNIKTTTDRESADIELTEKLNLGWEILHINAGRNDGHDYTAIWRVVTLMRDVPDDASGDDDHVELELPGKTADAEPAVTPLSPAIIIEPPAVPAPALNEALDHPIVQAIRQNGSDAVIVEANRELLQVAEAASELRRTHVVRRPPVPTFLLPERI